ncbi:hypothetical protein PILCRDRAFT_171861 [Piloderma croceum F 1598]|uniref:Uncharacterized protein n=1 Tax=Piloderma croceum (strain F 1598) TaxID=765440 RepID=A0A0C3GEK7_PILCF|nr:hypothetical protein PILCRDRAFT_171861 [Piloderma croceum F 1598]
MDGSSNIPLPSVRTTLSIGRKELPQPKLLPFSIKRQDPIQIRNNSPKPGFFENPNSRVNSSNNDLIQTQSYGLPENGSYKQSIKNSKPFFSSQPHSDPNRRTNSQIARPIFGSHFKVPLKFEENASIHARESSPLGHQAHIPTSDETEVDTRQYSPPSNNRLQHPFPPLIVSSTAPRLSGGQQSAHSNGFALSSSSSSSHPVPNFPESPNDIQFESSHVRASSRASTNESNALSQSHHATPPHPQPHANAYTSNRSRSQSVLMLPLGIEDTEDVNTSAAILTMTNNANLLRIAKFEIAEGKRHVESLESQLDSMKDEKAELARRLDAMKDTAKKAMEASGRRLDELETSFKSLKITSDESGLFVAQVKSSMVDFKQQRKDAADCLKKVEPLLNEDGEYIKGSETKSLVNELQIEYQKTQEVVTMLREKLVAVGGDLVVAKSRVRELEMNLLDDKLSLKKSAETLLGSSREMSEMASYLNKQKHESLDALACAADAEGRLHTANERIVELSQALDHKVEQLTAARGLQLENTNLRNQLDSRDAEIVSLGSTITSINESLSDSRELIQEQKSKLQVLHTTIAFQEQNLKDFEDRTLKAETATSEQLAAIQVLQDRLQGSDAREGAEALKKERLVCERDAAANRVRVLESEAVDARRRIGERDEKLHQANIQYHVLQERFDDQSVTLRITKESNGDLNERLTLAESTHATSISQLQLEVAVVHEQKIAQQDKYDVLNAELKHRQESEAAILANHQAQLSRQDADNKHIVQILEQRAEAAERNLADANAAAQQLRSEIGRKSLEMMIPSVAHKEQIDALEAKLREQDVLFDSLKQRADTISKRYKEGNLNDAEAAFVHSLINKTQALHEQENVSKANELRRVYIFVIRFE